MMKFSIITKKYSKNGKPLTGFTVIELIVVVVIIVVLASIVLISVTSYVGKAKVVAVKSDLLALLANSKIYFDASPYNTGADFKMDVDNGGPSSDKITTAIRAVNGNVAIVVGGDSGSQSWCEFSVTPSYGLTPAGTWCVDSVGHRGPNVHCSVSIFTCK
jgi:prepilin-type N-terminal cleavage/methylation domain-containing protein